jgi:proteasome assembly chaperone (PAC2) family protein
MDFMIPSKKRESVIHQLRDVQPSNPILIAGLPGIGLVANIFVVNLVKSLQAEKFVEVYSPYFEDVAYTTVRGELRRPTIEIYVADTKRRSLILLYGNTQPTVRYGQYELSGKVLDFTKALGCQEVVCFAGLKRNYIKQAPEVFCTASEFSMLERALRIGVNTIVGEVYGMAGLLVGLARLKEMKGICFLAETLGISPDVNAARAVLEKFEAFYDLKLNLSSLSEAVKSMSKIEVTEHSII